MCVDNFTYELNSNIDSLIKEFYNWANKRNINFKFIWNSSEAPETIQEISEFFLEGIDWLFIDGDHSYEAAKTDFENYAPLMNKNGIVVLHDIVGHMFGVKKLWNEIKKHGFITQELVLVETDNQVDCGIGLIYF